MDEEILEPGIDGDDVGADEEEYDTEYKRSMKWDLEKGDFVVDSGGRIQECSGTESFITWCVKASITERNTCLAYTDAIGTEMEDALSQDDAEIVESMVQRTIEDALMVNPRTESVDNFEFWWDGDELHGTYDIKGIDWDEVFKITF